MAHDGGRPLDDGARIGQIVLNLVLNAADALAAAPRADPVIRIEARAIGDNRVEIAVADNGPGIPDDLVDQLFDPFFTTKPTEVGSGLGLYVSHNIATSLGGEITVASRLGEGTTVRVALPVAPLSDKPIAAGPPHATVVKAVSTRPRPTARRL